MTHASGAIAPPQVCNSSGIQAAGATAPTTAAPAAANKTSVSEAAAAAGATAAVWPDAALTEQDLNAKRLQGMGSVKGVVDASGPGSRLTGVAAGKACRRHHAKQQQEQQQQAVQAEPSTSSGDLLDGRGCPSSSHDVLQQGAEDAAGLAARTTPASTAANAAGRKRRKAQGSAAIEVARPIVHDQSCVEAGAVDPNEQAMVKHKARSGNRQLRQEQQQGQQHPDDASGAKARHKRQRKGCADAAAIPQRAVRLRKGQPQPT